MRIYKKISASGRNVTAIYRSGFIWGSAALIAAMLFSGCNAQNAIRTAIPPKPDITLRSQIAATLTATQTPASTATSEVPTVSPSPTVTETPAPTPTPEATKNPGLEISKFFPPEYWKEATGHVKSEDGSIDLPFPLTVTLDRGVMKGKFPIGSFEFGEQEFIDKSAKFIMNMFYVKYQSQHPEVTKTIRNLFDLNYQSQLSEPGFSFDDFLKLVAEDKVRVEMAGINENTAPRDDFTDYFGVNPKNGIIISLSNSKLPIELNTGYSGYIGLNKDDTLILSGSINDDQWRYSHGVYILIPTYYILWNNSCMYTKRLGGPSCYPLADETKKITDNLLATQLDYDGVVHFQKPIE